MEIPEIQNLRLEPTGRAKPGKPHGFTATVPGLARQTAASWVFEHFCNRTEPHFQSKPGPVANTSGISCGTLTDFDMDSDTRSSIPSKSAVNRLYNSTDHMGTCSLVIGWYYSTTFPLVSLGTKTLLLLSTINRCTSDEDIA